MLVQSLSAAMGRGEAMCDDFDPHDRDEDVRDIEMPWIELGRGPGSDREEEAPGDRAHDVGSSPMV